MKYSESLRTTGHPVDLNTIENILGHFINVRIVTEKDEMGNYELRHDAIAGRIYERMSVVEKELIELKVFLDNSYRIYEQRKVLLTENDLNYISVFENKLILNSELKDFVNTSKKEIHKKRIRRRYLVVSTTLALILVLSAFSLWAYIEKDKCPQTDEDCRRAEK